MVLVLNLIWINFCTTSLPKATYQWIVSGDNIPQKRLSMCAHVLVDYPTVFRYNVYVKRVFENLLSLTGIARVKSVHFDCEMKLDSADNSSVFFAGELAVLTFNNGTLILNFLSPLPLTSLRTPLHLAVNFMLSRLTQ